MSASPFARVYFDLPTETHEKFKARARELGKPMKVLLAELIERECSAAGGSSKPKRKRKE